jgi:hypothetical protein
VEAPSEKVSGEATWRIRDRVEARLLRVE